MPFTVREALAAAGLSPDGGVSWGTPIPATGPGVYIVALTGDVEANLPVLETCPISEEAVELLLETRPELRLDGERPDAKALSARVSGFWLPDEVILYIGLAGTSLRKRVGQYYRTPLGARKPHAGGWFLKLLSVLDGLTVHFTVCGEPDTAESQMIRAFCDSVSEETRAMALDPDHPFPFANLEWPPGVRKRHGITGAKGHSRATLPPTSSATRPLSGAPANESNMDIETINDHIQQQLRIRGMHSVSAVQAAGWLEEAGLLGDSPHRPGLPLRNLLRGGHIVGQRQEPNHRWFIDRIA
jgi:hypothetical protein